MSFPERFEVYASRWVFVGFTIGLLFFAYTSFLSRTGENAALSWILTFVFLACVPIMVAMIFRPPGMILSPDGMTLVSIRSQRLYPWESLSQIRVQKMPGRGFFRSKRVWFHMGETGMGKVEKKLAFLTNRQGMLPSNFGYSADQLAEILLAFQDRALARISAEK